MTREFRCIYLEGHGEDTEESSSRLGGKGSRSIYAISPTLDTKKKGWAEETESSVCPADHIRIEIQA